MRRKSYVTLTLAIVTLLCAAAHAQVRGTSRRVLSEGSAVLGGDLSPALSTEDGWGWLQAEGLDDGQPLIIILGRVNDLDPLQAYSLSIDGKHILDFHTNQYGDAELEVVITGDSALLGSYGAILLPGIWSAEALRHATVLDDSMQAVLEGKLSIARSDGSGHTTTVYEDRIGLQDLLGNGMTGMARVEQRSDGSQLVETSLTGLQPGARYTVLLDGVPVTRLSADSGGAAAVRLSTQDRDNQLPALLQPVQELQLVQWTAADDALLASGTFSGTTASRTLMVGTVESVAEASFVLALDDPASLVTVLTNEQTKWRGELTGIADLQPGMPVLVRGRLAEDGSMHAWMVAGGEQIPEDLVHLSGPVQSVADSSFVITTHDDEKSAVTVLVDEETVWRGGLSGIGDLEVGALVSVVGEPGEDGSVEAAWVAGREDPPPQPREVPGTVESVGDASFVLLPDANPVPLTVLVNDETRWGGSLGELSDLQPASQVVVHGQAQEDGSLLAWFVTDRQGPPVQPVRVSGTVGVIGDSSFELIPVTPIQGQELPETVTVVVGEGTRWGGTLSGLGDLEPELWVHVEGELQEDGSLLAWHVIGRDEPPQPAFITGTVESVGDNGFVLLDEEGTTLSIAVNEHTVWAGDLHGFGDLEPGMQVHVRGELQADGSVLARMVASLVEPPVVLTGVVEAVADSSFTMIEGKTTPTLVLVDEHTRFAGDLSGLGDLEPGMPVRVQGELQDDGSVLALAVAGVHKPPVVLTGVVEAVGDSSFTMIEGKTTPTLVLVDEHTRWAGDLSGLADLEPGMQVRVQGELQDDGSILALMVAGEQHLLVTLNGIVESVGDSFFTLVDAPGTVVHVQVNEHTRWADGLSGLSDLEPGMQVRVKGELQDNGSILAQVVAAEEQQVRLTGTVETVGDSGFTMIGEDGTEARISVNQYTVWAGDLLGLGDLEPGLPVHVKGVQQADGSVLARMVAGEQLPPQPVTLNGTVRSIAAGGFTMTEGRGLVHVHVNEETVWAGDLSSLGDLEPGMHVRVEGAQHNGGVLAHLVAGEQLPPQPVALSGSVGSVGANGFTLIEGKGGMVHVHVNQETVWAGGLSGLGDLEPGMPVHVEGELQGNGGVKARLVADEQAGA